MKSFAFATCVFLTAACGGSTQSGAAPDGGTGATGGLGGSGASGGTGGIGGGLAGGGGLGGSAGVPIRIHRAINRQPRIPGHRPRAGRLQRHSP